MLPRVDQRFILDSPTWSPPLIGWGLWLKHNCTPCLCTLSRWPRRDAIRLTDYVLSGDEVIPFFFLLESTEVRWIWTSSWCILYAPFLVREF